MPAREVRIVTDHFARWPVTVSGKGYDPSIRTLLSSMAIAEVEAVQTSWETRIAVGDPTVPYDPPPAVLDDHLAMLAAAERTLAAQLGGDSVVRSHSER